MRLGASPPDNPWMHHIVSFATPPAAGEGGVTAVLARLAEDFAGWTVLPGGEGPGGEGPGGEGDVPGSPAGSLAGDAGSVEADDPALTWTPPHERLLAQALGLEVGDGQVPIGGLLAARAGLPRDGRVWARVSPSHWHLGTEQVTLRDSTDLALDEADARALFGAARPWFEDEGFSLEWLAPTLWLAAHPALARLRTASLDRVTGRNVDPWLGADPQARRLRRLQSEVQMLWHTHPVNARREVEGRESVNSFWIDGCGPMPESDVLERAASVVVDERLRAPALRGDHAAWQAAMRQVVDEVVEEARACAGRGAAYRVSWCGERRGLTMAPAVPHPSMAQRLRGVWRALRHGVSPQRWPIALQDL